MRAVSFTRLSLEPLNLNDRWDFLIFECEKIRSHSSAGDRLGDFFKIAWVLPRTREVHVEYIFLAQKLVTQKSVSKNSPEVVIDRDGRWDGGSGGRVVFLVFVFYAKSVGPKSMISLYSTMLLGPTLFEMNNLRWGCRVGLAAVAGVVGVRLGFEGLKCGG